MSLVLYESPTCGACWRVRKVLEDLELDYESVRVSPWDRSEVMRLSGQPRVPMLVDGDEAIADSYRIIAHLNRRYGDAAPPEPKKPLLSRLLGG